MTSPACALRGGGEGESLVMHIAMRRFFLACTALASASALASKCSIPADVHFEHGSAQLSAVQLERAIQPIKRVQSTNTVLAYIVVGHADKSEAIGQAAELLSLARAGAVALHVLRIHPELKDVLHLQSKGASQPVSQRSFQNRRVEIEVQCIVPPPYFDKYGTPIL